MQYLLSNSDFFNHVFRFNYFLMFLDVVLLGMFFYSFAKMFKETGRVIDYWHFISIQFFVIPVLLMYPFNASLGNITATGNAYYLLEPFVSLSYIISITGYLSFLIGGSIAKNKLFKINVANYLSPPLASSYVVIFFSFVLVLMFIVYFSFQFVTGEFSDPRAFFMEHFNYRPIYNLFVSYFKVFVIILGVFYIDNRRKWVAVLLVCICMLGVFLGTRSSLIDPICYVVFIFFVIAGKKIKLWHAAAFFLSMVIAVFALGAFRSGNIDKIFSNIVYGNTFSDTRDFAWILSYWDFNYVHGKTYLSGLISFIPSSMSEYREVWTVSRYTNRFVGFDSLIHPGLRPGKFGEPFFNFGIIGVSFLGIFLGFCLKKVSNRINSIACENSDGKAVRIFLTTLPFQFISMFCLTSGFFEFYVTICVILCMFLFYHLVEKIKNKFLHG